MASIGLNQQNEIRTLSKQLFAVFFLVHRFSRDEYYGRFTQFEVELNRHFRVNAD